MAPAPHPQPAPPSPRASPQAQWHRALAIAHTIPSPASDDATQRARRDKLASTTVVLTLTATGLALGRGRHMPSGAPNPSTSTWSRLNLQLGLTVLGVALLVTGVVVAVRSGYWRAVARGPLSVLNRPERRLLMRQLRGKQPLDVEDHQRTTVLTAVALGLRRPWGYLLVICGTVTNVAAQVVGAPQVSVFVGAWVLCLALFAAASVLQLRDQRAAERFLEQHLWSRALGAPPPGQGL